MQSLPADTLNFNLRSYSDTRLRCWCKPCEAEQKLESKAEIADGAAKRRSPKAEPMPPQSTAGLDLANVWTGVHAAAGRTHLETGA